MARRRSGGGKGNVRTVNFKGVSTKRPVLPEDDYLVAVSEVSVEDGQEAEYYKWVFEVVEGKYEGSKLYYNTSLAPQALFNLRGLLEALGVEVPDDEFDVDPKDVVGAEMMAVVTQERYQGKLQSKIGDFYAADDASSRDEEKDDDKPKSRRSSRDDEDDKPRSRRSARDDKDENEDDAPRGRRRSARDEEGGEEEDKKPRRGRSSRDTEEDDKPRGRSAGRNGKKKGPDPVSAEEVEDMKQRELEDLCEELELDVDFEKNRTLTKQRNAVIDALQEADLLAE